MNYLEGNLNYSHINGVKANFDEIYTQADPREFFRVLYGLDYVIPDLAKGIFRNTIAALEEMRGRQITVLDLGCSYGVNSALIRHPLDIDRLAQRYRDLDHANLTTRELIELDRHYFLSWPRKDDVRIIGLDSSQEAIDYAKAVGLIDDGIAANLETDALSASARKMLRNVDFIISTGCVGYVTERTFAQILDAIDGPPPWVASFVLRMFPYHAIASLLEANGIETEALEGVTFVQRRLHSAGEYENVLRALERRGIDPSTKEREGLLHAELFLSRPAPDQEELPLQKIVSVTSGANRDYGRRFVRIADNTIRFGR